MEIFKFPRLKRFLSIELSGFFFLFFMSRVEHQEVVGFFYGGSSGALSVGFVPTMKTSKKGFLGLRVCQQSRLRVYLGELHAVGYREVFDRHILGCLFHEA